MASPSEDGGGRAELVTFILRLGRVVFVIKEMCSSILFWSVCVWKVETLYFWTGVQHSCFRSHNNKYKKQLYMKGAEYFLKGALLLFHGTC